MAESKKRNELDPLTKVRVQEDLTPRRLSLLRVVKSCETVKYSYTRNAVNHAITEGGGSKYSRQVTYTSLTYLPPPLTTSAFLKELKIW